MILQQVLITIALLVGLEAALRLVYTLNSGPLYIGGGDRKEWFTLSADVGWDRRPNFKGRDICGAYREFDTRGLVSADGAQLKDEKLKDRRVLFIGDSNTYGYCLATGSTFVEVADRLLPDFALINMGVPAYTSYQGYKQLLKYGELINPKIIFISFNFNDRRYVLRDADVDSDATLRRIATKPVFDLLERIYLFRVVRALGRKAGIVRVPTDATTPLRVDRLKPRVDPQSYKNNLIKMVEWARRHGAAPYFILLGGDNPNRLALLRRGKAHLDNGNYEAAIEDLKKVTSYARSSLVVLARKYLSIAYRATGRAKQAEQTLWIKPFYSAYGGDPMLEDSEYNKVMRDVAKDYKVPLVDAQSKLEQNPRVFFDEANHFDAEGHEMVGKMIRNVLLKQDGSS
jgi:lysophospholipase L1-like esterase